ncbi:hypothetical protein NMG60_11034027 [Bertholletia excelsa]
MSSDGCSCGSDCKCGSSCGCENYTEMEHSAAATTTIVGVTPPAKMHSEGSEKSFGAEGGHTCKCGSSCSCDPCTC